MASLLEHPLPEYLCITRPRQRVGWGIPVPFSEEHVTYVWFDALLNYVSAVGYGVDERRFAGHWPADVHLIGKDILRHHAVYWPIVLHALGLSDKQMPRLIFAHGWWKVGEQKMSKSLGNIVDPFVVVRELLKAQPYAADVYRYFLLRDVPFGQDGAFSEEALLGRLEADLANDLGNLVNRTLSMIERYCSGKIPSTTQVGRSAQYDDPLQQATHDLAKQVDTAMSRIEFSNALDAIMRVVSQANQYIELTAPWKLTKGQGDGGRQRLHTVLYILAHVIRVVAITLEPFMPSVSASIRQQLSMGDSPHRLADATSWTGDPLAGKTLGKREVLFPKT